MTAEKVKLAAKRRDVFGRKTKKGRREGLIPAVIYGREVKSESLWVDKLDFKRLIKNSGESAMINLSIDQKDARNVIIYDLQNDPIRGEYTHVDFFQVRMDEEIETEVELVFSGESPAVKELGGVLVKNMDEIEIKCLPNNLPSEIEVDIATLRTFEDRICIKDLKLPQGVEATLDPETVVVLVSEPRSVEELESLEEKVEADVNKVEGVVKESAPAEGENKK